MFSKIFSKTIDSNQNRVILSIFGIKFSFKFKAKIKFPKNAISTQKILSNPETLNYKNKTATIFALFNKDGLLLENTLAYLQELKKYTDFLVVVSDCPMLEAEIEKLSSVANAYIIERHNEYDFGSYKRGFLLLQNLNVLQNVENLILCNDSVVYNGNSIEEVIKGVKAHDFFGMTINKNGYSKELILDANSPHIQSYFVSVSKNIFEKPFFTDFMNSIKKENKKELIIYNYEQGLSRVITTNGFEMNSFYPVRENDSTYPDPYFYYLNNDSSYTGERIFLKKNLLNLQKQNT